MTQSVKYGAGQLQAALFFRNSNEGLCASDAWNKVSPDAKPDTQTTDRKTPQQTSKSFGSYKGKLLTLTSQIGRLDVLIAPGIDDIKDDDSARPAVIEHVEEAIRLLKTVVECLDVESSVARIGIVANLVRFDRDEERLESLEDELGFLQLPSGSSEISLRFNSRVSVPAYPDITLNRILEWQEAHLARITMQIPSGTAGQIHIDAQVPPVTQQVVIPAVTLKIDLNTAVETPIRRTEFGGIFNEMIEQAVGFSANGVRGLKQ